MLREKLQKEKITRQKARGENYSDKIQLKIPEQKLQKKTKI